MDQSARPLSVVVVDDEVSMRDYLNEVLDCNGYSCRSFADGLAALSYLSEPETAPDLVLTDISMPGMSGIELLRSLRSVQPDLPVILISGLYELGLAIDALKLGATDYLLKPAKPADIAKLLDKHLKPDFRSQHILAQRRLAKFMGSRDSSCSLGEQLQELFDTLGFKRYETLQHSRRVAAYSLRLGGACSLDEQQLEDLEAGSLLHDIGKIITPHNVLLKDSGLDDDEWSAMKLHPRIGAELLAGFPELWGAAEIVYSHHERYDGEGYPRGQKGDEIPLGARIFSIVDTFDAITSDRPYRAGQSTKHARGEIHQHSGTQFEPRLVEIFLEIPEGDLDSIRQTYPERASEMASPVGST